MQCWLLLLVDVVVVCAMLLLLIDGVVVCAMFVVDFCHRCLCNDC